jgi:shikimate kinase
LIRLVGPGGAGKSTVGARLASRLDLPFIDLDMKFMERVGDISQFIDRRGYEEYARENVETYRSCMGDADCRGVLALSSGFMTYPQQIHPAYDWLRMEIATSVSTLVLLPSLELETCVAETVRRQVARPFGGSREREEAVIRERYFVYMAVPAPKVETMRPVDEVVDKILAALPLNKRVQPTTRFARGD